MGGRVPSTETADPAGRQRQHEGGSDEAQTSSIGGKCAELDIHTTNVSATYGVTAWYYCYSAEVSDDEPN